MSVEPVHAFRASDGTCHESKQSAYNADVTHMYRTLPKAENRSIVAKEFDKFVRSVEKWLDRAVALNQQMKDEADVETSRSIRGQG